MVVFTFVQWRLRKLRSGGQVPEVLPCGTFDWHCPPRSGTFDWHT